MQKFRYTVCDGCQWFFGYIPRAASSGCDDFRQYWKFLWLKRLHLEINQTIRNGKYFNQSYGDLILNTHTKAIYCTRKPKIPMPLVVCLSDICKVWDEPQLASNRETLERVVQWFSLPDRDWSFGIGCTGIYGNERGRRRERCTCRV